MTQRLLFSTDLNIVFNCLLIKCILSLYCFQQQKFHQFILHFAFCILSHTQHSYLLSFLHDMIISKSRRSVKCFLFSLSSFLRVMLYIEYFCSLFFLFLSSELTYVLRQSTYSIISDSFVLRIAFYFLFLFHLRSHL